MGRDWEEWRENYGQDETGIMGGKRCQEWFYTAVAQTLERFKQLNQEFKNNFFCLNTQKSFLRTVLGSQKVALAGIFTYSLLTAHRQRGTFVTSAVPTPNTIITDFVILHTVFTSEAKYSLYLYRLRSGSSDAM